MELLRADPLARKASTRYPTGIERASTRVATRLSQLQKDMCKAGFNFCSPLIKGTPNFLDTISVYTAQRPDFYFGRFQGFVLSLAARREGIYSELGQFAKMLNKGLCRMDLMADLKDGSFSVTEMKLGLLFSASNREQVMAARDRNDPENIPPVSVKSFSTTLGNLMLNSFALSSLFTFTEPSEITDGSYTFHAYFNFERYGVSFITRQFLFAFWGNHYGMGDHYFGRP